jgi:hypothetical protein
MLEYMNIAKSPSKRRSLPVTLCLEGIRLVEIEGYSVRAAANKTGYTPNAISRARKRFGLPPLPRGRKSAVEEAVYASA